MNHLKEHMLAYIDQPGRLTLSDQQARRKCFDELPDELYELAESMSPKGATFAESVAMLFSVSKEAVKLADAWPGEGPAARIAAAMKPGVQLAETAARYVDAVLAHYDAAPAELLKRLAAVLDEAEKALAAPKPGAAAKTGDFGGAKASESRPDVMLAALANEIRLSEDVDYGKALSLAKQRDPELAKRYAGGRFADPAPAPSTDRPDIELAERAKARAEKDSVDYGKAMSLELAENLALAARYLGGAGSEPSVKVKVPAGMRLVSERPDVQLAERVKVRQERDGVDWAEASRLELAEDAALASRYADWKAGRTALQEAAYRAEQIRTAPRSNLSPDKAFSAALAEDPQLRAGVSAYFEKAN